MKEIGGNIFENSTVTTNVFIDKSFTSTLLAAANSSRACIWIINKSNKDMYINFDNPATEDFIKIKKGEEREIVHAKGAIYGIWKSGAKDNALIIETSYI